MAEARKLVKKIGSAGELEEAVAVGVDFLDFSGNRSGAAVEVKELEFTTDGGTFARFHERPPLIGSGFLQKKDFEFS
ncbi:MAG: hypothetical protein JWM04_2301 [Verrucomicrobiales bacterium]|nr:hypothetical protein [Verrucomicrobiales bacterium]